MKTKDPAFSKEGRVLGSFYRSQSFFSLLFPKFGNNWRYVPVYGGFLSLFVNFPRSKTIKFVKFHIFGKKNQEIWKSEKLREKDVEIMGENSPIRMTLTRRRVISNNRMQ